ncbi:hypothetical protein CROQUDRAFT_50032 [Cronartium quercuum f. sp. fusiforme G11]|uniref:Uncharacterized protein n=1 Tax=Cronartium quercuum f. sp. fusiforme G11 TaxID=708437 RepID=A0A9P6T8I6_9BASI|nr:hypothetical protein CROQUDRAFT_50032 [Cronartium quercuum f. sp. fusiforme G11]
MTQHTAAEGSQGAHTWYGQDETGLFEMACQHDHCITFISVEKSGEKAHFVHALLGWVI